MDVTGTPKVQSDCLHRFSAGNRDAPRGAQSANRNLTWPKDAIRAGHIKNKRKAARRSLHCPPLEAKKKRHLISERIQRRIEKEKSNFIVIKWSDKTPHSLLRYL
jgi:hypothetical protein